MLWRVLGSLRRARAGFTEQPVGPTVSLGEIAMLFGSDGDRLGHSSDGLDQRANQPLGPGDDLQHRVMPDPVGVEQGCHGFESEKVSGHD